MPCCVQTPNLLQRPGAVLPIVLPPGLISFPFLLHTLAPQASFGKCHFLPKPLATIGPPEPNRVVFCVYEDRLDISSRRSPRSCGVAKFEDELAKRGSRMDGRSTTHKQKAKLPAYTRRKFRRSWPTQKRSNVCH